MESRLFGRSGVHVSALGFGCGAVGGLMVRADPGEQREAVAMALDAGITYFDTAPSYGDGVSETNLGRVLTDLRAQSRVVVGTKVMLADADLRDPRRPIRDSVEASLRRMHRDNVDVVYLHNVVGAQTAAAAVSAGLRELVAAGLAAQTGFTAVGETSLLKEMLGRYDAAQCYFNALNPSGVQPGASGGQQDFDGLVVEAADRGVGVVAIRVYAAGALSATQERHPIAWLPPQPLIPGSDYADDVGRAQRLEEVSRALGMESPLELSLRFVLGTAGVSTALVGLSSLDHLRSALRWASRGPLDEGARAQVLDLARA